MSDPNELFTKIFMRTNERFAKIYSLRNIAELGLPVATVMLHKETDSFVRELVYDPKNDNLFTDKAGLLKEVGGAQGTLIVKMRPNNRLKPTAHLAKFLSARSLA